MILTCRNCDTRYTVADSAVGPQGRKVRCISCGHVWFQPPASDEEPERTLVADTPFDEVPRPAARVYDAGGAERRKGAWKGWAVLGVLVAGIAAGGLLAREAIVGLWPPAALLYETVGLPVPPPGAGLQLQNVRSEQRTENGATVLVVEGQIVNASDAERRVPKLHAVSIGFDRKPVQDWTIDASVGQLLPGEIATFQSTRRDLNGVAEVTVTFEGG